MSGLAPAAGLWRELAGWGLAAATAALPLSLALVWLGGQSGQRDGLQGALMAELATPPAMAVVAAAPPAPPALPDLPAPAPVNLPEPMPQEPPPVEAALPKPPEAAPLVLPKPPEAAPLVLPEPPEVAPPVLPDAEAAQPVAQAQRAAPPATRPKARPQRAAEAAAAAPPVSGATAAAKPAADLAARAGDDNLQAGWGAAIRKKIERRKAYPKAAAGAAGRVILRMTVAQNGRLLALVLAGTSGNAALDRAAVAAVERAGRLPAAPKGLQLDQHVFTLPMDFSP